MKRAPKFAPEEPRSRERRSSRQAEWGRAAARACSRCHQAACSTRVVGIRPRWQCFSRWRRHRPQAEAALTAEEGSWVTTWVSALDVGVGIVHRLRLHSRRRKGHCCKGKCCIAVARWLRLHSQDEPHLKPAKSRLAQNARWHCSRTEMKMPLETKTQCKKGCALRPHLER